MHMSCVLLSPVSQSTVSSGVCCGAQLCVDLERQDRERIYYHTSHRGELMGDSYTWKASKSTSTSLLRRRLVAVTRLVRFRVTSHAQDFNTKPQRRQRTRRQHVTFFLDTGMIYETMLIQTTRIQAREIKQHVANEMSKGAPDVKRLTGMKNRQLLTENGDGFSLGTGLDIPMHRLQRRPS